MMKSETNRNLIRAGRAFYSIGIIAFGIQQIIIRDFRPQILPPFPAWAHQHIVFPLVSGIALIVIGVIISGMFKIGNIVKKKICLYLAFYFLSLIVICQVPYNLFITPYNSSDLGIWTAAFKELAYCGGALIMAGTFVENTYLPNQNNPFKFRPEKLIPAGSIFFSIMLVLFGYSHFLYTKYVEVLVPAWFGIPVFWTYFGGIALICSGIAIIFKIAIKQVGFLLATMIFLWFIFLHVPRAIAYPKEANGNEIVSAFDALLFSGVALLIAITTKQNSPKRRSARRPIN